MNQNDATYDVPNVSVALIDATLWRVAAYIDEDSAMTLFAVASEDPADWDEMVAYWPRYRTPVVAEFADGLPLETVDDAKARSALTETDRWLVIDFVHKRIVTGTEFQTVGRDQVFAMDTDEKGDQHAPLSIHLPPWWELHEQTPIETIDRPRETPIDRPRPNRKLLFGQALVDDLASRVLEISQSDRWRDSGASDDQQARYPFTIEVHRDWLMTPRADLDGKTPREMLHGGMNWNDLLVWAQRLRFEDGARLIAAPSDVVDFADAPMGREEVCIYFDLCREIIEAGWFWCGDQNTKPELSKLCEFLHDVKANWLKESFEGGSPPRFIIECSRRRVPRGSDVAIVGMDGRESEQHVPDCDCPICEMMADGLFGVGFTSIDGHHLELDDEFAFSLCETREEWEKQQREYEEFSAEMARKQAERGDEDHEPDEFSSAWSGNVSESPIPGDGSGNLKLAFLLAEIVSTLQSVGAPQDEITDLNARFREFREADADSKAQCGDRLKACLEEYAGRHEELVSRAADFQSRVDESIRQSGDTSDEFPF